MRLRDRFLSKLNRVFGQANDKFAEMVEEMKHDGDKNMQVRERVNSDGFLDLMAEDELKEDIQASKA